MLDPMDKIQKSYSVVYNRKQGFIALTNRKVIVVEEKGFFRSSYNVVLEIPYTNVKEVDVEGTHRLTITDSEGKKHVFVSLGKLTAAMIEGDLKDLIRAVFP